MVKEENKDFDIKSLFQTEVKLPEQQVSNLLSNVSVLGLVADQSACGYYRVINPLHMLKLHGAKVHYTSASSFNILSQYDIIIAPRQHDKNTYETLRYFSFMDKKIFFELDDDLEALEPENPAFLTYHRGSEELKFMSKIIKNSLGMTTTTPEIAKEYSKYNKNVSVLPNFIDVSFRDWRYEVTWNGLNATVAPGPITDSKEPGYKIIGYAGGNTHSQDVKQIGVALARVLKSREDVKVCLYSSPDLVKQLIKDYGLPEDKVIVERPRHFLEYPTGLHGIHIGLAPIDCTQFNLAKSDLKIKEYMAAGALAITSHVGPYAKFKRKHNNILTVGRSGDHTDWYSAICEALDYPDLEERRKANKQFIADYYTLEKNFMLWPIAWKKLAENAYAGNLGSLQLDTYRTYGTLKSKDTCLCGSGKKYGKCCYPAFG